MTEQDKRREILEANRRFFDTVADSFAEIDAYRLKETGQWVGDELKKLSQEAGSSALLDLGCGTGLAIQAGKGYFRHVFGIDLSHKMLREVSSGSNGSVCGDAIYLPFRADSFNVVACVSVLHHLFDHLPVFQEVHRVLKKGGLLYAVHDVDSVFMKRFHRPANLYRQCLGLSKKFVESKEGITEELLELADYHVAKGIDTRKLAEELQEAGFSDVTAEFYWRGANRQIDLLLRFFGVMGKTPRGLAPYFSVIARK